MQIIQLVNILIVLLLIPFSVILEGFRRKVIARMENRMGPLLFQPFYDILKLWQKKEVCEKNFLFNIVPFLAVIDSLALLLFIPMSILNFSFDWIVFCYLFILLDTFFLLGVFASKSPFGFHGVMREIILMIGYELGLLVVIGLFMLKANVVSFAVYNVDLMFLQLPLGSIGLIAIGLTVLKVTPFDTLNAESEISGGLFTEYFGKKLALLEIAEFIKNGAFYFLLGLLIFGKQYFLFGAVFFVVLYALNQTATPRYKVFKAAFLNIIIALIMLVDYLFLV